LAISDTIKTDRLFKESQDRRMTSINKAFYEEEPRNLRVILGNEVWLDSVDSTPATAVSQGIAFKCAGWLIEDTSVANEQAWYSSGSRYAGGYWKRWIPPKCGQGYTIKIYKSGSGGSGPGTELGTTDVSDWVFDYQEGTLWFQDAPGYANPYYISGYRYSGTLTTKSALNSLYKSANATFSITGARDIQTWNSARWQNSGITWDGTLQKWKPKKSGAATAGGLNNVVEDTTPQLGGSLDGQTTYGIYNTKYISSQGYSGNALKIGTTKITTILDEDSMGSDSATALATQQSIKAFVNNISGNLRWRFPASSTAISKYYPSSLGKATSGSVHNLWNWSSNKSWYANSSNVRSRFVASSLSLSRYNQYIGHSGNTSKHMSTSFSSNAKWVYDSMIASGNEIYASYKHSANSSLHTFNIANYITSTNSIIRFAPSTLTLQRYNQYVGHSGNTSVHSFNATNYITSSNAISRFADSSNMRAKYAPSGNDCPRYIFISGLKVGSGNRNLSGATWTTSYSLIKTIYISTTSINWNMTLYPKNSFINYDPFPKTTLFTNMNGSKFGLFDIPYKEWNGTNGIHINFIPIDDYKKSANIYVTGYKLRA